MAKTGPHTEVGEVPAHSRRYEHNPSTKLELIAAKARNHPQEKFNNLLHHINRERIEKTLAKMDKKGAAGIDGLSVKQVQENLSWLLKPALNDIYLQQYQAPVVRRVYIPKSNGGQRPLGVPTVLDRALQGATAEVLSSIYEQDFQSCSFGFRPLLSCHHALATTKHHLNKGFYHVLEVDIRDFFGSLNHEWLRKFLELRIGDPRVLALIQSWLKAGVLENDQWVAQTQGVPQGGSISPLLANI